MANIFKLGTRYSEPLGANYLDEDGQERPIVMGSYGIGPARIVAAAIEQYADEHGISWPRALAPFEVHLVGLGKPGTEEHQLAERLYGELLEAGIDVLYDDRDMRPGEKFVEAELLGCPLRVVAGKRSLEAGELEVQVRRGTEKRAVPIEGAARGARRRCSPSCRDRPGRRHAEAARPAPRRARAARRPAPGSRCTRSRCRT